ncbi:MAG TPA: GWxTD domain-containing protein [Gemmatimonadaceae bacterium]|nr:GWxTD domain-containing protein [Gemmatimonadaceae bacterium]
MMRLVVRGIAAGAVALCVTSPLRAQLRVTTDTLGPDAVRDSLAALRALDAHLQRNRKDAEVWYRQGRIAALLAIRAKQPNAPRGLDQTRLDRMADSSFVIAMGLAPSDARYPLALSRLRALSPLAVTRYSAAALAERAFDKAVTSGDSSLRAEAAIELARIYWRRYERLVDRRIESTPGTGPRSLADAMCPQARTSGGCAPGEGLTLDQVRTIIDLTTRPLPPDVTGEADLARAIELFRDAYDAAPAYTSSFHWVAMALGERNAWLELETHARRHLSRAPWDARAWLALGLAQHRRGVSASAAASIDSGFAYLNAGERARLSRLDRVLPQAGAAQFAALSNAAQRRAYESLYWQLVDPLWSSEVGDARTEFLARVIFAELRWSDPDIGQLGADTDRGDIYVRNGPPEYRAAFGAAVAGGSLSYNLEALGAVSTVWAYQSGLLFVFNSEPMSRTGWIPRGDGALVKNIIETYPLRLDNMTPGRIDSLPTRVARFRATRDSVDVFVAFAAPRDTIGANARNAYLWFMSTAGRMVVRDSSRVSTGAANGWRRRVPVGSYAVRVETTLPPDAAPGRSTTTIDAGVNANDFATQGFGISDVLLATSIAPSTSVARWTDLAIQPSVGSVGSQISLAWENYDFTNTNGAANYTVSVFIGGERSLLGRIAARIAGVVGARVDRRDDGLVVTVDRSTAFAPTIVDQLVVDLTGTPPGRYSLRLDVTDRATGRKVSRAQEFVIAR